MLTDILGGRGTIRILERPGMSFGKRRVVCTNEQYAYRFRSWDTPDLDRRIVQPTITQLYGNDQDKWVFPGVGFEVPPSERYFYRCFTELARYKSSCYAKRYIEEVF